jgi:hypothetical protein
MDQKARTTPQPRKEPPVIARLRARLSYANVTATVALFVALGGTTYAAATLPKNSVGSRQLRRHAVSNSKLRPNAVTASTIKPGAVTSLRVRDGSLTGKDINSATLGKVPAAATADHATSADSASSLGGVTAGALRVGCPGGTARYAGACFETAQRAAQDWPTAAAICGWLDRRLASPAELAGFSQVTHVQFGGYEWTSSVIGDGSPITVNSDGVIQAMRGGVLGYWCAASLSN